MRLLLTGGAGLLGKYLKPALRKMGWEVYAPSHRDLDVTKKIRKVRVDLVIHAAAYTNVALTQHMRLKAYRVNVEGTENLACAYWNTPFVYISTEYARRAVNFYGETKAYGELMVALTCSRYLIIRTLFKPTPYPWDVAFTNQYTQGDYVDVIAPLIAEKVREWYNKGAQSGLTYVGTGRKTMYELARRTRPDVKGNFVEDIEREKGVKIPKDYQ